MKKLCLLGMMVASFFMTVNVYAYTPPFGPGIFLGLAKSDGKITAFATTDAAKAQDRAKKVGAGEVYTLSDANGKPVSDKDGNKLLLVIEKPR